jgi:hypothetical protein
MSELADRQRTERYAKDFLLFRVRLHNDNGIHRFRMFMEQVSGARLTLCNEVAKAERRRIQNQKDNA